MFASKFQRGVGHGINCLQLVLQHEDIEFLVKESEVLTGLSGRDFVILGPEQLIYRVSFDPCPANEGSPCLLNVEQRDALGHVLGQRWMAPQELRHHRLFQAHAQGHLFTPPVTPTA